MKKVFFSFFLINILLGTNIVYGMKRKLELEAPQQQSNKKLTKLDQYMHNTLTYEELLHISVEKGDETNTRTYLQAGANINSILAGKTALQIAIEKEHIPIIVLLLNPNPTDKCFANVLKQNSSVIMHRYITHQTTTQSDLDNWYQQAKQKIYPTTKQYASVVHLFIQYYEQKQQKTLLDSYAKQPIVTTTGLPSTVLYNSTNLSHTDRAENYIGGR